MSDNKSRIWSLEHEIWVSESEYTPEYEEAMQRIQPILDAEFGTKDYVGKCHAVWTRQKELLIAEGINWCSPAELNPDIIFD